MSCLYIALHYIYICLITHSNETGYLVFHKGDGSPTKELQNLCKLLLKVSKTPSPHPSGVGISATFRNQQSYKKAHFTQRLTRHAEVSEKAGFKLSQALFFHSSHYYFHHFSYVQRSATPWMFLMKSALLSPYLNDYQVSTSMRAAFSPCFCYLHTLLENHF